MREAPTASRTGPPRALGAVTAVTAVTLGLSALVASTGPAAAGPVAPDEPVVELLAHYRLDETGGTVAADSSGNGRDAQVVGGAGTATWQGGRGLRLPGGASTDPGAFPAVRLPDGLLAGLDDVTVAYDVLLPGTGPSGPVFSFGDAAGGYLSAAPGAAGSTTARHQASLAAPGAAPATAAAPTGLVRGAWTHVAVTVDGGDDGSLGRLTLHEDGRPVGETSVDAALDAITSPVGYLGRSPVTSGNVRQFTGTVKDVRVYSGVLPADELRALSDALAPGNVQEVVDSLSLGDLSGVREDLALPAAPGLTWTSSDPAVVSATGRATRPAVGAPAATATLTATVTQRGATAARSFVVTVLPRVDIPDAQLRAGLVHEFELDETSGTTLANTGSSGVAATLVNPDKAELTGRGVRFNPGSYESSLTGAYVRLPDDITAGMRELTVDYEVRVDPANVGNHQMFGFGGGTGSCDVGTGAQGSIWASNTAPRPGSRFRVVVGDRSIMQAGGRLLEGAWKHVTYTQALEAGGTTWTGTVYVDGVRYAQATGLTTPPSVSPEGTGCNFLARSQVAGHYSFRGTIADFRVYDRAVGVDEVLALAEETVSTGVRADAAAIDLGDTGSVVRDLVLPELGSVAGSSITWTSSDPSVVDVSTPPATAPKVPVVGRVTRPASGQPDATVTLTATLRKGAQDVTVREIQVTVEAEFDDADAVARDSADLVLYSTDDVRGDLDLPAEGGFGSAVTWSSTTDLITPTGEVTRPGYGRPAVEGTLTATVRRGDAASTRTFPVTVRALPREEEDERYFLGYFKGENIADGEQIMFATSDGNDALNWTGLTGGRPSLVSQLGDQGLRDPHIVRSPDGDTFYMIATDLNWYDQGGYDINDTQYIEVFESHDLVTWTPQRHVEVAPDDAGNAFAPESLWIEEIGAYAVFWAQSLWDDPVNRTGQGNAQMWYALTRDFQTFSEARVWQDPAPLSRIDTTAIKVGDQYYRFTKNEAGNAGSDIFSEKNTDFLETDLDAWTLVAPALGRTTWVAEQAYEGPVVFRANPGDTACPGQFYLWGDRYSDGGGYQGACSADIEAPTWEPKTITMTNAGVPRPRHGTVIPITLREWNDIRGIPNEDVATTTALTVDRDPVGGTATATAVVAAQDTFETGGQVRFTVGPWSETVYLEDGRATVTLPSVPGRQTVTAEFLGYGILEASVATAELDVPAELAVDVAAEVRCLAARTGVLRVTVTNRGESPVSVAVVTPYGSRTLRAVQPGGSAFRVFATRTATVPAGSSTVTITGELDGAEVTTTREVPHPARDCRS
ncbi:immunoglobulin-like domain-containing protein [Aquipuribacter hungaricus]|uniref:Immunoglobulin-like domain-containing protein n=1 Tax=Aquipuribacter hungaricus TaxID=545624 RepID=A0ABV7WCP5_9MICO